MAKLTKEKKTAFEYFEENSEKISDFHQLIWGYAEPALREYKSYDALVRWHRDEGFEVEEGIAGMPTPTSQRGGEADLSSALTLSTMRCQRPRRSPSPTVKRIIRGRRGTQTPTVH
jgi:hypothetical protein